jgi:hypothetical protein
MSTQSQRALLLRDSVAEFERRVNALLDYEETCPQATLGELEAEARGLSRDCFAPVLEALLGWRSQEVEAYPGCECGDVPLYKGQQQRSQETFVGRITWQRGYYYCETCRRGRYPLDEALGIGPGQFSEGLQEGLCRLGAALPFVPAAETFTALTGVSISPREGERLTEGRGGTLAAQQTRVQTQALAGLEGTPSTATPTGAGVWAVALDAAKVRFDDGWHDVKAGVVFWAQPRWDQGELVGGEATAQSYVGEVGPMEQAGARLYTEAVGRGIKPAEDLVVCLGDGAPSNWSQFALHFPKRVEVLDWYHGVEHLWAAGNGVFGQGTPEAQQWVAGRKEELWKGEVEKVLAALEQQGAQPGGPAAAAEVHYFETNRERMRYAEFRAQGYPVGSGTVESACKRVIGARLKQAGMCWTKAGAQAVLSLRAQLLSGRWETIWPSTRPQPKAA